eukprot:TRINITY_DN8854_c0_g1_i1.p2 TRINITY_DN8854_c0_g1~~TRINITY_DN8854_c0_g1_i1.p2  ORF type:complete len:878 (+),score=352.41 TRINITY_DN8854_c0_g1_i1:98-2731(+)
MASPPQPAPPQQPAAPQPAAPQRAAPAPPQPSPAQPRPAPSPAAKSKAAAAAAAYGGRVNFVADAAPAKPGAKAASPYGGRVNFVGGDGAAAKKPGSAPASPYGGRVNFMDSAKPAAGAKPAAAAAAGYGGRVNFMGDAGGSKQPPAGAKAKAASPSPGSPYGGKVNFVGKKEAPREEVKVKLEPAQAAAAPKGPPQQPQFLPPDGIGWELAITKVAGAPMGMMWRNSIVGLAGVRPGSPADLCGGATFLRRRLCEVRLMEGKEGEKKAAKTVKGPQDSLKFLADPTVKQATEVRLKFEPCPDFPVVHEEGIFEPAARFVGPRPGMWFGSSARGVGYHRDTRGRPAEAASPVPSASPASPAPEPMQKAPWQIKEEERKERERREKKEKKKEKKKELERKLPPLKPAQLARADQGKKIEPDEDEESNGDGKEYMIFRERPDETMGFSFNEDMTLRSVAEGSPADEAGLKAAVGWKLTKLEGKRVKKLQDCVGHIHAMTMRMYFKPDEEVSTITVEQLQALVKKPEAEKEGFDAFPRWIGKRTGFYFGTGEQGTGYYKDPRYDPEEEKRKERIARRKADAMTLQEQMRDKLWAPGSIVPLGDKMVTSDPKLAKQNEEQKAAFKRWEEELEQMQREAARRLPPKRAQCLPAPPGLRAEDADESGAVDIVVKRKKVEERMGWDFDHDMLLRSVVKKTAAQRAGLDGYMGWKLIRVEGKQINDWQDLADPTFESKLELTVTIFPPKHGGVKQYMQVEERAAEALEAVRERDGVVTSMREVLECPDEKGSDGRWLGARVKETIAHGALPTGARKPRSPPPSPPRIEEEDLPIPPKRARTRSDSGDRKRRRSRSRDRRDRDRDRDKDRDRRDRDRRDKKEKKDD